MTINAITLQLRTIDLAASIRFPGGTLGFTVDGVYEDSYAGVRVGSHAIHLKRVDAAEPSIAYVEEGGYLHLDLETTGVAEFADRLKRKDVAIAKGMHETPWSAGEFSAGEFVVLDDQGHTCRSGEAV